jgi:phosphatidylglycerol---prolipoprotein diacylglyceryl transferase
VTGSTLHLIFESAGYLVGGQLFWWQRRRQGDPVEGATRWLVIGAAIFGAAVGSRVLAGLENPAAFTLAGKTIVGGLLGGLIGVELAKKAIGETRRTGDLFAIPIAAGTAVGRIGCFLGGLEDSTHGLPTALPWGYDYGDGIRRHPAQLYEIAFCLALVLVLARVKLPLAGDRFKLFMTSYLGWRLLIDFLKPGLAFGGLTAIQWTALGGLLYYARDIRRWLVA